MIMIVAKFVIRREIWSYEGRSVYQVPVNMLQVSVQN